MPTPKQFLFPLKAAIAFAAIYVLFRCGWVSMDTFVHLCQSVNIPVIGISCLLLVCAQLLSVIRLILLLKTIQLPLSFFEALKLNMIGWFFNTVLPGALGGDFVKGYYLFKSEEATKGKSISILLADRVCGFLAILLIGSAAISYLLLRQSQTLLAYRQEALVLLAGILLLFLLLGLVCVLSRRSCMRLDIENKTADYFFSTILHNFVSGFAALLKHGRIFTYCLAISLAIQLLSLSGLLVLVHIGGGDRPDYMALAAVSSAVIIFSAIPITPGNIGWTELLAAIGWSAVGSKSGGEIFLYWRIISGLCALPGGIVYLLYSTENKVMTADIES